MIAVRLSAFSFRTFRFFTRFDRVHTEGVRFPLPSAAAADICDKDMAGKSVVYDSGME